MRKDKQTERERIEVAKAKTNNARKPEKDKDSQLVYESILYYLFK